ncbi:hypothetical protein AB0K48_19130 [Nonomuraea sp. NPDC055795]
MRGLAQRLGVAHSALYRWVRNRDELLDLVSDALLERVIHAMEDHPDEWRSWLTQLAWSIRRSFLPFLDHEGVAQFPRITATYDDLRRTAERILQTGGMRPAPAADTYQIFLLTVWGWLAAEKACSDQNDYEHLFAMMVEVLIRGLPAHDTEAESTW